MKDLEGVPKVKFDIKGFFEELKEGILDIWDGELYLELHNGTYTTMAENKKGNRRIEGKFRDCELLISMFLMDNMDKKEENQEVFDYYQKEFKNMYKLLLLDQFHDVLPGTAIEEVYNDTRRHYAFLQRELTERISILMKKIAFLTIKEEDKPKTKGFFFYNSLNYNIDYLFELNGVEGFINIPACSLGFISEGVLAKTLEKQEKTMFFVLTNENSYEIHNKTLILTIEKTGLLLSIKDKRTLAYSNEETMKEAISNENPLIKAGNSFLIHEDIPFFWDAWDIFPYYKVKPFKKPFKTLLKG